MANEKTIQTRVIQKHDVEENWLKATNFSPKQGEIIIYDIDENYNYERMKIGDGVTNVNDLPFITEKEAVSINAIATGEIVTITDASPLEHEIGVKVSGGETLIMFTNMDQGDFQNPDGSSNSEPNGDYVVEDNIDGLITFTDGSSLIVGTDISTTGDVSDNIVAGNIIRMETDIDEGYWQAYLVEGFGDFSTVTLTKYGKNFFNENKDYGVGVMEENGEKVFYNSDPSKAEYLRFDITEIWDLAYSAGVKLSVSFDLKTQKAGTVNVYALGKKNVDATQFANATTEWQRFRMTFGLKYNTTGDETCRLSFFGGSYGSGVIPYIKNIQIEFGDSVSEYEPYKKPISYIPNADGTVDGVTSYYPTTTLITDTDGIIIEAEYIKNVNEALGVEPTDTASTLVVGANIFDMLRFTKQTLTDAQKAQVIENLGLADYIRSIIQEESETVAQNYLDTTIAEEASW